MAPSDTEKEEDKAPEAPPPLPPASSNGEKEEEGGTLDCSTCGENCWKTGWFLAAEEGSEERKTLCDDCFLIAPNIKGADRCLRGQVKIIVKKEKKPKAAKKGTKAKH